MIKISHLQFKDKVVKQSNITEIIVGATVALVLVLISFGICYWCGFFKRTTPEERAKQEGLTDTGFDNHETLLANNEIYQQLFSAWNLVN